jgi:hypothetical protein
MSERGLQIVIRLRSAPFGFGLHYLEMVGGFVKISNPPEWQMARENDFSSSVAGWTCRGQVASGVLIARVTSANRGKLGMRLQLR